MFRGAFKLKDLTPLAGWDVSNVEDMSLMFAQCTALYGLSGLEVWDVSHVEDLSSMFADCYNLENWRPFLTGRFLKRLALMTSSRDARC